MAGTTEGGKQAAITNKKNHGKDFYQRIGAIGGRKTGMKGFALMSPERRKECGAKGGSLSRRNRK